MAEFKDYICSYRYDCAEWTTTIRATSIDDAAARIKTLGTWGRVDGELMAVIPAVPGAGLLVRLWYWLRNKP